MENARGAFRRGKLVFAVISSFFGLFEFFCKMGLDVNRH